MMSKRFVYFILGVALICGLIVPAQGRKKGFHLNAGKVKTFNHKTQQGENSLDDEDEPLNVRGSFMVASQCTDCNNGYMISQITFSGYDKPQQSSKETFFITNNTDRTMSGVSLYIDYRMPDGRQLHKRFLRLTCNIPPGETRMADIDSWDKQREFYFEKSPKSKRGGTPYCVVFDPVSFNLRF